MEGVQFANNTAAESGGGTWKEWSRLESHLHIQVPNQLVVLVAMVT